MRAIIVLALLGSALAVPKSINRIVGGSATSIEEYPYMANMQYGWFGIWWSQACGGSLINERTVLSAAHCYEGDLASSWRVVLGTTFISSGGTTHTVSRLIIHERYSGATLDSDVALVLLSTSAVLSNTVATARIAGPNFVLPDDTVITAVGWGTLWSGGPSPNLLQHVDINVINQEICAARYAYLKTQPGFANWPDITDNMVCAGILDVGGKDACQGDSGGPVSYDRDIVFGITSWGYGCADATYPGVLARVGPFANWIATNSQ